MEGADVMFPADWDCRWKVIRMMIEGGVKLYDSERTRLTGGQLDGGFHLGPILSCSQSSNNT